MTGVHNAELSDMDDDNDSSKWTNISIPRNLLEATSYLSTPTGADLGGVITKRQYSNVTEKADSIESLETLPKVDDKDMLTDPSRLDEAQVVIINE